MKFSDVNIAKIEHNIDSLSLAAAHRVSRVEFPPDAGVTWESRGAY